MQRPKSVAIYKIGCNIQNAPRIRLPLCNVLKVLQYTKNGSNRQNATRISE